MISYLLCFCIVLVLMESHAGGNQGPRGDEKQLIDLEWPYIRRDKLNSQFIVTKFSILHAGGRSLFTFQTSTMLELEIAPSPAH